MRTIVFEPLPGHARKKQHDDVVMDAVFGTRGNRTTRVLETPGFATGIVYELDAPVWLAPLTPPVVWEMRKGSDPKDVMTNVRKVQTAATKYPAAAWTRGPEGAKFEGDDDMWRNFVLVMRGNRTGIEGHRAPAVWSDSVVDTLRDTLLTLRGKALVKFVADMCGVDVAEDHPGADAALLLFWLPSGEPSPAVALVVRSRNVSRDPCRGWVVGGQTDVVRGYREPSMMEQAKEARKKNTALPRSMALVSKEDGVVAVPETRRITSLRNAPARMDGVSLMKEMQAACRHPEHNRDNKIQTVSGICLPLWVDALPGKGGARAPYVPYAGGRRVAAVVDIGIATGGTVRVIALGERLPDEYKAYDDGFAAEPAMETAVDDRGVYVKTRRQTPLARDAFGALILATELMGGYAHPLVPLLDAAFRVAWTRTFQTLYEHGAASGGLTVVLPPRCIDAEAYMKDAVDPASPWNPVIAYAEGEGGQLGDAESKVRPELQSLWTEATGLLKYVKLLAWMGAEFHTMWHAATRIPDSAATTLALKARRRRLLACAVCVARVHGLEKPAGLRVGEGNTWGALGAPVSPEPSNHDDFWELVGDFMAHATLYRAYVKPEGIWHNMLVPATKKRKQRAKESDDSYDPYEDVPDDCYEDIQDRVNEVLAEERPPEGVPPIPELETAMRALTAMGLITRAKRAEFLHGFAEEALDEWRMWWLEKAAKSARQLLKKHPGGKDPGYYQEMAEKGGDEILREAPTGVVDVKHVGEVRRELKAARARARADEQEAPKIRAASEKAVSALEKTLEDPDDNLSRLRKACAEIKTEWTRARQRLETLGFPPSYANNMSVRDIAAKLVELGARLAATQQVGFFERVGRAIARDEARNALNLRPEVVESMNNLTEKAVGLVRKAGRYGITPAPEAPPPGGCDVSRAPRGENPSVEYPLSPECMRLWGRLQSMLRKGEVESMLQGGTPKSWSLIDSYKAAVSCAMKALSEDKARREMGGMQFNVRGPQLRRGKGGDVVLLEEAFAAYELLVRRPGWLALLGGAVLRDAVDIRSELDVLLREVHTRIDKMNLLGDKTLGYVLTGRHGRDMAFMQGVPGNTGVISWRAPVDMRGLEKLVPLETRTAEVRRVVSASDDERLARCFSSTKPELEDMSVGPIVEWGVSVVVSGKPEWNLEQYITVTQRIGDMEAEMRSKGVSLDYSTSGDPFGESLADELRTIRGEKRPEDTVVGRTALRVVKTAVAGETSGDEGRLALSDTHEEESLRLLGSLALVIRDYLPVSATGVDTTEHATALHAYTAIQMLRTFMDVTPEDGPSNAGGYVEDCEADRPTPMDLPEDYRCMRDRLWELLEYAALESEAPVFDYAWADATNNRGEVATGVKEGKRPGREVFKDIHEGERNVAANLWANYNPLESFGSGADVTTPEKFYTTYVKNLDAESQLELHWAMPRPTQPAREADQRVLTARAALAVVRIVRHRDKIERATGNHARGGLGTWFTETVLAIVYEEPTNERGSTVDGGVTAAREPIAEYMGRQKARPGMKGLARYMQEAVAGCGKCSGFQTLREERVENAIKLALVDCYLLGGFMHASGDETTHRGSAGMPEFPETVCEFGRKLIGRKRPAWGEDKDLSEENRAHLKSVLCTATMLATNHARHLSEFLTAMHAHEQRRGGWQGSEGAKFLTVRLVGRWLNPLYLKTVLDGTVMRDVPDSVRRRVIARAVWQLRVSKARLWGIIEGVRNKRALGCWNGMFEGAEKSGTLPEGDWLAKVGDDGVEIGEFMTTVCGVDEAHALQQLAKNEEPLEVWKSLGISAEGLAPRLDACIRRERESTFREKLHGITLFDAQGADKPAEGKRAGEKAPNRDWIPIRDILAEVKGEKPVRDAEKSKSAEAWNKALMKAIGKDAKAKDVFLRPSGYTIEAAWESLRSYVIPHVVKTMGWYASTDTLNMTRNPCEEARVLKETMFLVNDLRSVAMYVGCVSKAGAWGEPEQVVIDVPTRGGEYGEAEDGEVTVPYWGEPRVSPAERVVRNTVSYETFAADTHFPIYWDGWLFTSNDRERANEGKPPVFDALMHIHGPLEDAPEKIRRMSLQTACKLCKGLPRRPPAHVSWPKRMYSHSAVSVMADAKRAYTECSPNGDGHIGLPFSWIVAHMSEDILVEPLPADVWLSLHPDMSAPEVRIARAGVDGAKSSGGFSSGTSGGTPSDSHDSPPASAASPATEVEQALQVPDGSIDAWEYVSDRLFPDNTKEGRVWELRGLVQRWGEAYAQKEFVDLTRGTAGDRSDWISFLWGRLRANILHLWTVQKKGLPYEYVKAGRLTQGIRSKTLERDWVGLAKDAEKFALYSADTAQPSEVRGWRARLREHDQYEKHAPLLEKAAAWHRFSTTDTAMFEVLGASSAAARGAMLDMNEALAKAGDVWLQLGMAVDPYETTRSAVDLLATIDETHARLQAVRFTGVGVQEFGTAVKTRTYRLAALPASDSVGGNAEADPGVVRPPVQDRLGERPDSIKLCHMIDKLDVGEHGCGLHGEVISGEWPLPLPVFGAELGMLRSIRYWYGGGMTKAPRQVAESHWTMVPDPIAQGVAKKMLSSMVRDQRVRVGPRKSLLGGLAPWAENYATNEKAPRGVPGCEGAGDLFPSNLIRVKKEEDVPTGAHPAPQPTPRCLVVPAELVVVGLSAVHRYIEAHRSVVGNETRHHMLFVATDADVTRFENQFEAMVKWASTNSVPVMTLLTRHQLKQCTQERRGVAAVLVTNRFVLHLSRTSRTLGHAYPSSKLFDTLMAYYEIAATKFKFAQKRAIGGHILRGAVVLFAFVDIIETVRNPPGKRVITGVQGWNKNLMAQSPWTQHSQTIYENARNVYSQEGVVAALTYVASQMGVGVVPSPVGVADVILGEQTSESEGLIAGIAPNGRDAAVERIEATYGPVWEYLRTMRLDVGVGEARLPLWVRGDAGASVARLE